MGIYAKDVQKLYIAYFNRPADVLGLAYWEDQVAKNGGSTAAVANAFSASQEYKDLYAGKSSAQIIDAIYQNLFGRPAEQSGLIYWGTRLDNGTFNIGNIAMSIMVGAQNDDLKVITNKTSAADSFTTNLDTSAEIIAYSGNAANAVAKAWLATVGATDASLTAANTSLASTVTSITSTTVANGSTFTLTTGIDTFNGTSSNDTFIGDNSGATATITAADQVNGGAGTDTFNYYGYNGTLPVLNGVENVNIYQAGANSVDVSSATGVQKLSVDALSSAAAARTIKAGAGVAIALSNNVDGNKVVVDSADATVNLTLNKVTLTAGTGLDIGTATNVANTALNLSTTGKASSVKLINTGGKLATVTVTGDQKLTLDASGATAITKIDASAATAAQTITVDTAATTSSLAKGTLTVLGGTGNDTVDLSATNGVLTATDVIDGGAGTDTLAVVAADLGTVFGTNKIANVENVKIFGANATAAYTTAGAVTVDASKLASATGIEFAGVVTVDTGKVFTVNNLANNGTITFDGVTGGKALTYANGATDGLTNAGLVVNLKDAALNTNDTLNLVFNGATNNSQTVDGLTAANVENLGIQVKLDNVAGPGVATLNGLADSQLSTITLTSAAVDANGAATTAAKFVTGASANFTSTIINKIDASAYNGAVDVSTLANNLIASGATILGGKGVLTATGGAGADQISTGSGGGSIKGGAGADTIDLSASTAKADTVTIVAASDSTVTAYDQIKGFTNVATNGDKLVFAAATTVGADVAAGSATGVTGLTGAVSNGIVTFAGTAAATATLANHITAAQTFANAAANKAVAWVEGSDLYVLSSGASTATSDDVLVKLVGISDATALSAAASAAKTVFIG